MIMELCDCVNLLQSRQNVPCSEDILELTFSDDVRHWYTSSFGYVSYFVHFPADVTCYGTLERSHAILEVYVLK